MEKATGMPAKVFIEKNKNIAKKDATSGALTNVKQYLNKNAQRDFKNLPDAFAKDSGKATFIPENVKKALYKKNDKDQFILDKSKTLKDYKNLLGEMEKPVYRAREAQTIKGLVALSLRNMMFEKAVPNAIDRMSTGVQFSKTVQNFIDDRLFDLDTKGAEGVLQKYIGKGIHDINSEKGIDEYFDDLKRIVLPMFPKGFISKTMLRPSNRIFSKNGKKSITVDGKENYYR